MDEIQAAFLSVKLRYLDVENQRRRKIAEMYCSEIRNKSIVLPFVLKPESHVWHLFVIRSENRDSLQQFLKERGIETMIHYPIPPHKQHAFRNWSIMDLPVTEKIHNEVLSLPMSPVMKEDEIRSIVKAVNAFKI